MWSPGRGKRSSPWRRSAASGQSIPILSGIQQFHGSAYDWHPQVSLETIFRETGAGGHLLRTKIRAAIEYFDQLYQYGEAGKTKITELGTECLDEEEETPPLPEDLRTAAASGR